MYRDLEWILGVYLKQTDVAVLCEAKYSWLIVLFMCTYVLNIMLVFIWTSPSWFDEFSKKKKFNQKAKYEFLMKNAVTMTTWTKFRYIILSWIKYFQNDENLMHFRWKHFLREGLALAPDFCKRLRLTYNTCAVLLKKSKNHSPDIYALLVYVRAKKAKSSSSKVPSSTLQMISISAKLDSASLNDAQYTASYLDLDLRNYPRALASSRLSPTFFPLPISCSFSVWRQRCIEIQNDSSAPACIYSVRSSRSEAGWRLVLEIAAWERLIYGGWLSSDYCQLFHRKEGSFVSLKNYMAKSIEISIETSGNNLCVALRFIMNSFSELGHG